MILQCTSVSVVRGQRQAVEQASLDITKPELIGLIGPNGAGKTSLMRAIAGLQPYSGVIVLQGDDLGRLEASTIARRLAYLPQERAVHWPLCVYDVVMLGRLPHRAAFVRASQADIEAVEDAMQHVAIADFADRPFNQLSGGEQARVLIARMIAQQADLIIADEPTSGLDPSHQIDLMEMFRTFVSAGKTILTSLHDLPLASLWCDRIILLDGGRLVADGPVEEVMTAERIEQAYGVRTAKMTVGDRPLIVPTDRSEQQLWKGNVYA